MDALLEIRVIMLRKSWGVKKLSEIWDVSPSQANKILNGTTELTFRHIQDICNEAGLQIKLIGDV